MKMLLNVCFISMVIKKVFLSVSIATISNFLQKCTLWRHNYETYQPKIGLYVCLFIQISHSLHLVHIQQWYIKGICSREFLHVEWVLRLVEGCLDTHFQWVASSLESYILGPSISGTLLNNPLILPLTKILTFLQFLILFVNWFFGMFLLWVKNRSQVGDII